MGSCNLYSCRRGDERPLTALAWLAAPFSETNGFDLLLDAFLTWISVVLDYASPYFMKQILDALLDPTDENIASGFVYASLAFLGTILKAESDVNHLWFSRRAAVRVKSELTSAIYEKALKRKDASGVGEGKGAAGVGKIVKWVLIVVTGRAPL